MPEMNHFAAVGALMRVWWQPVVVTSPLDVFDLNKRAVLLIASPEFGRVAYVIIGALQVGSIHLSVAPGDRLAKVQCHASFLLHANCILCSSMHACMHACLPGLCNSPRVAAWHARRLILVPPHAR